MSPAHYQVRGRVAVITLDNPPLNGLGHALRAGIVDALDRAMFDAQVRAIVLTGSDRAFSAGADVREFGTPKSTLEPRLSTVIRAVEQCEKPVIAALSGACLGGGLELALGAHFRIARADASVGLPEVKLGLIPGAGGTQRLPRLIGIEPALNLMVKGDPHAASSLAGTALFDRIVEDGELLDAALAFAEQVIEEGRPLRRASTLRVNEPGAEAWLQFARSAVAASSKNFPAPLKCVEAVSATLTKSFEDGMKLERELFQGLMNTPESRALRHVFAAERAAGKIAGLTQDVPTRPIHRVAVIGAGTMGGGIAMSFANAGLPVVLLETTREALDRGLETIRRNYENTVKKGKLAPQEMQARLARITPTLDYGQLRDVDLVVEAVFEEMGVKEQVFRTLDEVARPGAILASNTSTLDLDRIADFTRRPQDVVGLHFFSPANVMKLLEVVRGAKTAPEVLATAMELAKRIKKVAVVSGVCDGFIGNRMIARYTRAADDLLRQGALPQQVDQALERFGMAMGPFRMGDLAGLDISWAIRKRRAAENPAAQAPVVADRLCEAGRFGQKTGAGWYRYEAGQRMPLVDPAVQQIVEQARAEAGIQPRRISDEEVVERSIYALVNEGARLLEEGIAQRASDIDVVYLHGYGFPRHRGGPMLYADQVGLPNVVRALRRIAAEPGADAAFWTPAPLLERLAQEGRNFN